MATPPNKQEIFVDAWVLRCIFNSSLILARLAAGEFTSEPKKKPGKPRGRKRDQDPEGTVNEGFWYLDRDGNEVATVHYYHLNHIPLSPPDPKTITIGSRRYVVHRDPLDKDPEKRLYR